MIGPGQPYYYPPQPPPPPPKPPLSPLVIVLLVVGGMMVLGGGACLALGALYYLGAQAESDADASAIASPASTASPTSSATASTGAGGLTPLDEEPTDPTESQGEDDGPTQAAPSRKAASGASTPTPTSTSTAKGSTGGSWWCTASASVRVCGFAGACNYQMVFGNGTGSDRFLAQQQAKNACEASARAKGASAICIVQCSPR